MIALVLSAVFSLLLFGCSAPTIQFEEVDNAFPDLPNTQSYGSAWADFNADNCVDLFIGNHSSKPSLLVNNCKGSFSPVGDDVLPLSHPKGAARWPDFHGAAWGDYDNDGDPDLLISTGGAAGLRTKTQATRNYFWENKNGRFEEMARNKNLTDDGARGRTPSWLDYDGDGLLDVALGQLDPPDIGSVLRRQENGVFKECSELTGSLKQGLPDKVRLHYVVPLRMGPRGEMHVLPVGSHLFPRWTWIAEGCSFRRSEKMSQARFNGSWSLTIGDFNNDLRPDFLFPTQARAKHAAEVDGNQLNARFVLGPGEVETMVLPNSQNLKIWITPPAHWPQIWIGSNRRNAETHIIELNRNDQSNHGLVEDSTTGLSFGYDPAGNVWRFRANNADTSGSRSLHLSVKWYEGLSASGLIDPIDGEGRPDILLSETPQGIIDISDRFMPADRTRCRSGGAGDFDNDGDLDVYLVCSGSLSNAPDRLYSNQGGERFLLVEGRVAKLGPVAGIGGHVSVADYDNDGKLDLYVANGHGTPFVSHGRRQLLRNATKTTNNWVKFQLVGTQDNRDGVGARVFAKSGGRFQVRFQTGGVRRGVQDSTILHFGLGSAETVDDVIVQWPNGAVESFGSMDAGAQYPLRQGDGTKGSRADIPID